MRRSVRHLSSYLQPYSLSLAQRALLVPLHGVRALLDPTRGDEVAAFSDAINSAPLLDAALRARLRRLQSTPAGRHLLATKPLITSSSLDPATLAALPSHTLGHAYAHFMSSHGYSADARSPVKYTLDADLAYVSARYRQVHDFWHVLTGVPPTVLGEVTLKAFEAAHMGLPSMALSAAVGTAALSPPQRRQYLTHGLPWAAAAGARCGDLLSFDFEGSVARGLAEVRAELGVSAYSPPPDV